MQRNHGFQQQHYADDGMWMETQAQQQGAFRDEEYNNNNYHKQQFPGMRMKPGAFHMEPEPEYSIPKQHHGKSGGNYGMFQDSMHGGGGPGFGNYVHGSGKKFPFGGTSSNNAPHHHHQFSNYGGHHDQYASEEYEYEAYSEEHAGAAKAKMDEMKYERHNYWGGDNGYANPYNYNGYKNRKPYGAPKVEWTAKGV